MASLSNEFYVAIIVIAMFCGGLVKGVIGLGLPIVATSIMSSFISVRLVLPLILIPLVLTNCWQALSSGRPVEPLRRFWPLIIALMISIWLSSQWVVRVQVEVIYVAIGLAVLLFVASAVLHPTARLPQRWEKPAGIFAGAAGGVLGGLSTVWGPPMVIYLTTLGIKKEDFIRSVGWFWLLGSIPLSLGYVVNGLVTPQLALHSALACLPAMTGLLLGQSLRKRVNETLFFRLVLGFLALIALNLLRRGLT